MAAARPLYSVIRALTERTDTVLVGLSGGKDSVVTLDLCVRNFRRVEAYFYYLVPGLEFQEDYLDRVARRYGIAIHRKPHWCLTLILRYSGYRPKSFAVDKCPALKATDMETVLRADTGIDWIVSGERAAESLDRRGMLVACGGLDDKRKRCYPIAFWPVEAVRRYIKLKSLEMSPESALLGHSFGAFKPDVLRCIKDNWPDDFQRIKEMFPHVEAVLAREAFYGTGQRKADKVSVVQDTNGAALGVAERTVQPAQD